MNTQNTLPPSDSAHVADAIEAYLAGGLDAAERARFELHVAACAACATLLDGARRADAALRDLFANHRPDDDFEDRLVGVIRAAPARRRFALPHSILHPMVRMAASGVAAAIVVGAVGFAATGPLKNGTLPFMANGPKLVEGRWLGKPAKAERQTITSWSGGQQRLYIGSPTTLPANTFGYWSENELAKRSHANMAESGWADAEGVTRHSGLAATTDAKPGDGKDPAVVPALQGQSQIEDGRKDRPAEVAKSLDGTVVAGQKARGIELAGKQVEALQGADRYYRAPGGGGDANGRVDEFKALGDRQAGERLSEVESGKKGGKSEAVRPVTALGVAATKNPASDWDAKVATADFTDAPDFNLQNDTSGSGKGGGGGGAGGGGLFGADVDVRRAQDELARASDGPADKLGKAKSSGGEQVATNGPGGGGVEGVNAVTYFNQVRADPTGANNVEFFRRAGGDGTAEKLSAKIDKLDDAKKVRQTKSDAAPGAKSADDQIAKLAAMQDVEEKSKELKEVVQNDRARLEKVSEKAVPLKQKLEAAGSTDRGEPAIVALKDGEAGEGSSLGRNKVAERDKDGDGTADRDAQARAADPAKPGETSLAQRQATSTGVPVSPTEQPPVAPNDPPAAEPKAPPKQQPLTPEQQQQERIQQAQRKIIRNGQLTFEVDGFDSAAVQVTKIATEEGGFVGTVDSEKLANGKVKGTIIVRCPPERLDTLVLKLRGLGELKSQKIAAQDVTKQYTDIDSQLRAALAMEKRLLEIIAGGKGEIKDLLEAEKQLGVWREKLEMLKGEINYLNNQIALSTLTVTLLERDIKTATALAETEQVQMGLEAEDVEKARAEAIKAIETAKGRIIESDMRRHEAGQLSATITADVTPDAAGPLTDRLKQVGKITRYEVTRKQTTEGGTGGIVVPGLKVERKDTRFQISLYNLANIAPRQTTTLNLAAADVEKAYKAITDQVASAGGRVVTSQLSRPRPDQTTGTIAFEVPTDKADIVLAAIRGGAGIEVMRLDVMQNPDAQNATDAKRGFSIQVNSLASTAPRETATLQVAAKGVGDSFRKVLETARGLGARIITSQLNEQDANNVTAQLDLEVMRETLAAVETALAEAGLTVTRTVNRTADDQNAVDSKVRLSISLFDEVRLAPRETVGLTVAGKNVPDAFNALLKAAREAGARVVTSQLNQEDKANVNGRLLFSVPRENYDKLEAALKEAGVVVSRSRGYTPDGPTTVDTKLGMNITVLDERTLVPRETVSMTVLTPNVGERYAKVLEVLRVAEAQVAQSQLVEQNKSDITGTLDFIVTREARAAVEAALQGADRFNVNVARSQDVQNTVDTKVRMQLSIKDAERQPARERTAVTISVAGVSKAIGDIEAATIAAGGRKVDATQATNRGADVGTIVVDVPLAKAGEVLTAVRGHGEVTAIERSRNEGVPEGMLSRARIEVSLADAERQSPRQSFTMTVEVADVEKAAGDVEAAAIAQGGRKVDSTQAMNDQGKEIARIVVDVPLDKAGQVVDAARGLGKVTARQSTRDEAVPDGKLARARIAIDFGAPGSVRADRGLWDTIREGLSTSLNGLLISLQFIIVGLCLIVPWVLLVWVIWKLYRRNRAKAKAYIAPPPGGGPVVTPG